MSTCKKWFNILVIWRKIWQLRMLLLRSWRWHMECEMPGSPDTLRVLLCKFTPVAWSTVSESTVFRLPDFAWLSRFLQPGRNFLKLLITIQWATTHSPFVQQNVFRCFRGVLAQFEIVKHKLPCYTKLLVHLGGFQITQRMKKCTTCQQTNYRDTTNHSEYLSQLELLRSHNKRAAN